MAALDLGPRAASFTQEDMSLTLSAGSGFRSFIVDFLYPLGSERASFHSAGQGASRVLPKAWTEPVSPRPGDSEGHRGRRVLTADVAPAGPSGGRAWGQKPGPPGLERQLRSPKLVRGARRCPPGSGDTCALHVAPWELGHRRAGAWPDPAGSAGAVAVEAGGSVSAAPAHPQVGFPGGACRPPAGARPEAWGWRSGATPGTWVGFRGTPGLGTWKMRHRWLLLWACRMDEVLKGAIWACIVCLLKLLVCLEKAFGIQLSAGVGPEEQSCVWQGPPQTPWDLGHRIHPNREKQQVRADPTLSPGRGSYTVTVIL